MKDAHLEKIIRTHETFLNEVSQREVEMNETITQQEEIIRNAKLEISKLRNFLQDIKNKKTNTEFTQTEVYLRNVVTQTTGTKEEKSVQTNKIIETETNSVSKLGKVDTQLRQPFTIDTPDIVNKNQILLISGAHGKNIITYMSRQKDNHFKLQSLLKTECTDDILVDTAIENSKGFTKTDIVILWLNQEMTTSNLKEGIELVNSNLKNMNQEGNTTDTTIDFYSNHSLDNSDNNESEDFLLKTRILKMTS
ncbi:hypothetical protein JTB14_010011 [Gonioctena quinquepunctata]|nr:hypothetical protein JTB14_010011 [Gonioctena quinquepunctata]